MLWPVLITMLVFDVEVLATRFGLQIVRKYMIELMFETKKGYRGDFLVKVYMS